MLFGATRPAFLAWHSDWSFDFELYKRLGVVELPCEKTVVNDEGQILLYPVAKFKVGEPKSKLKIDPRWIEFCQGHQGANTGGIRFDERSNLMPAELSRRAIFKQLTQYQKMEYPENLVLPTQVECMLREELDNYIGPCRVLSLEEAINGLKDEKGTLEPLNEKTSTGFGFTNLATTKEEFFKRHWNELMYMLDEDWRKITKEGVTPLYIIKGSEKDERRDDERVFDFKTRLFSAACIIETIRNRRLFGDFARKFTEAGKHNHFFSGVGMDVYEGKWDEFIKYLMPILEMLAFDLKRQDKDYSHSLFYQIGRIVVSLFEETWHQDATMRAFAGVCHDPIVLQYIGFVFIQTRGNPSGWVGTIVFNTIAVKVVLLAAWVRCDGENTSMVRFKRWVRDKIIGDDLILTISPRLPPLQQFTQTMLMQEFAIFGWESEIPEGCYGTYDTATFAGRTSVLVEYQNETFFLPRIERQKVLAINEFYKEVEAPDRWMSRANACAELAFPYLFEEDETIFGQMWLYLETYRREFATHIDPVLRANAAGLWTLPKLWKHYTGREIHVTGPTAMWLRELFNKQVDLARERSSRAAMVLENGS